MTLKRSSSVDGLEGESGGGLVRNLWNRLPQGVLALAVGLGLSGLGNYIFLLVAGRELGDAGYAPLGALWSVLFMIAPGLFFPIEQELSRAISARRASGVGAAPVVRHGALLATFAVIVASGITLGAVVPLADSVFSGQRMLVPALALSIASFGAVYFFRGVFAGARRLTDYGWLLAAESVLRSVLVVGLYLFVDGSAASYGFALGIAPVLVLLAMTPGLLRLLRPGPESSLRELTANLGNLVAASFFSQALMNAAPLLAVVLLSSAEQEQAGAFIKAYLLTRVPIFLFQAVQAVVLPRLTAAATVNDFALFRKLFNLMLAGVMAFGVVGGLVVAVLGDPLLSLFGSDDPLPFAELLLLGLGNVLLLVAMSSTQGLVALSFQRLTPIGWGAGVIAFGVVTLSSISPLLRLELAFIAGSLVSAVVLTAMVLKAQKQERRLPSV